MKAHKTYEVFRAPVAIEIEHSVSGERRRVTCEGWNHRTQQVDVIFPLCGTYRFSMATGEGLGEARGWTIALASLRELRNDPDYQPTRVIARRPKRAAKPTETSARDDQQEELF